MLAVSPCEIYNHLNIIIPSCRLTRPDCRGNDLVLQSCRSAELLKLLSITFLAAVIDILALLFVYMYTLKAGFPHTDTNPTLQELGCFEGEVPGQFEYSMSDNVLAAVLVFMQNSIN